MVGLFQVDKLWLFVLEQEKMISVAVLDVESFHIPIDFDQDHQKDYRWWSSFAKPIKVNH